MGGGVHPVQWDGAGDVMLRIMTNHCLPMSSGRSKNRASEWLQASHSFGWYVLPVALGCMIPPTLSFAMKYSRHPEWKTVIASLAALVGFAAVFTFVHLTMKYGQRVAHKQRRKELEALCVLRNPVKCRGVIQMSSGCRLL